MISLLNRSNPARGLAIVLLSLGLVGACSTPTPDAKEQLVRSLKGASVDGYDFATREDATQVVTSLDNSAMRNPIKLANGSLVLRYTSVKDKKANTTRIYKTEIARNGALLTILVTDIASGDVVMKKDLAPDKNGTGNGGNGGDGNGNDCTKSEPECANEFFSDCRRGGFVQCEANRTCEPQISGYSCCFKNGVGLEITVIVWPTRLCLTRPYLPGDEQRLLLTQ